MNAKMRGKYLGSNQIKNNLKKSYRTGILKFPSGSCEMRIFPIPDSLIVFGILIDKA